MVPPKRAAASPAVIVPYDPIWPASFGRIASEVSAAFGDIQHQVEHIGSTAVPGLAAKPIIDVFAVVPSTDCVPAGVRALEAAGWVHAGDGGLPGRERFGSRPDLPFHHLYLVVQGNEQHQLQTRFRDILRHDPVARAQYAALKHKLAPLLQSDRTAYTEGKTRLIKSLLASHSSEQPARPES